MNCDPRIIDKGEWIAMSLNTATHMFLLDCGLDSEPVRLPSWQDLNLPSLELFLLSVEDEGGGSRSKRERQRKTAWGRGREREWDGGRMTQDCGWRI